MYCPRLEHFVRLNPNGTVSRCGHMVAAPQFDDISSMDQSTWLSDLKVTFARNIWPKECARCAETETINQTSIRLNALAYDAQQIRKDYLVVGGVLDNICNSACLTCNEYHSTKIGSLYKKNFQIVDNRSRFWKLPIDRITHLDINGGEPSASPNYRNLLKNLPKNITSVRINTNAGILIPEIKLLQQNGIKVTVTISLDGIGPVHDRVRWPIKWDKFYENLMTYRQMNLHELNTWTTVSALNICDFSNILDFVSTNKINHSWAFLYQPDVLHVRYKNSMTSPFADIIPGKIAVKENNQTELNAWLTKQTQLRDIT